MADVIIYGPPQSTYVRTARLALEEKSAPYSFGEFEFGSDAHKALHPFAKVPAMTHGDVQLFESLAIATYVDGTFDGPALQLADTLARARITSTIDYIYPYALSLRHPQGGVAARGGAVARRRDRRGHHQGGPAAPRILPVGREQAAHQDALSGRGRVLVGRLNSSRRSCSGST